VRTGSARTGPAGGVRTRYGASPLHLLLVLCSFALTGYAGVRLLKGDTLGVVLWFLGAALVHDLLFLPLYTLTDRALRALPGIAPVAVGDTGAADRGAVNHLRVPAFLSLLLLLVWCPLVLGLSAPYTAYTGLDAGVFWGRWLLITAALFGISALALLVRIRRRARRQR